MVAVSLLAPARANRVANEIVSLLHVASIVTTLVGETCPYHIVGRLVEVLLLPAIARVAGTW